MQRAHTETSGARIKARYTITTTVGTDGAQQTTKYFAGWFDSQRNEPCSPAAAADGKSRCVPSAMAASTYFADAACTQAIILVPNTPPTCSAPVYPTPKYVSDAVIVAGCSGSRLRPLSGTKVTPTNWYYKSGVTCGLIGAAPTGFDFYDGNPGAEVPASAFVEFSTTTTTL